MLQEIKDKVANTADIKSVLNLLLNADQPVCALKFSAEQGDRCGEIWLRQGNHIIAVATGDGKSGHDALLELLSIEKGNYELLDGGKPLDDQQINIQVKDIIADRDLVIQALKSVLNPANNAVDDADVITDEHSAPTSAVEAFEKADTTRLNAFNSRSKLLDNEINDDLAKQRQAEMENSATTQPDDADFHRTGLLPSDESAVDEARLSEIEALKKQDPESKDDFYQTPVKIEQDPEGGLNEQQQSVLRLVQEQYSDKDSFLHHDDSLTQEVSLRPSWSEELPELEPRPTPELERVPPVSDQKTSAGETDAQEEAASAEENEEDQPADSKREPDWRKDSVRLRSMELKLDEAPVAEEKSAEKKAEAQAAKALKERQAKLGFSFNVPKPVLIGLGIVALALPFAFMSLSHQHEEEVEIELDEKEVTKTHVTNYVDKESRAAKPQEPFRMPAGSQSGSGSGHSADAAPGGTGVGKTEAPGEEDFQWKQPTQAVAPLSSEQLAAAETDMQNSEKLMSAGQAAQAASLLDADVSKYPQFVRLRVAAIEANRKLGRYERVRQLCLEGMHNAAVEADFYLLLNMLKDVPKAGGAPATIAPEHKRPANDPGV